MNRKRIFEIIEKSEDKDIVSAIYDYAMIIVIIASLVPLAFKAENKTLTIIDQITVAIFIADYFLRCPECRKLKVAQALYKPVKCVETGIVYESIKDAAKVVNVSGGAISACIHGKSKTSGGYHWEYI